VAPRLTEITILSLSFCYPASIPSSKTTEAINTSTADSRGFVLAIHHVPLATSQMRTKTPLITVAMSDQSNKSVFAKKTAPRANPAISNPRPRRP
jgi:hypothetical protein